MDLVSIKTFRYTIFPKVYELLLQAIDIKLDKAKAITLIADIWTNKIMADFLGLAALIKNANDKQELIVIGMQSMNDHTAENIKEAIENLVNRYKFDKNLISGNKSVCVLPYEFFLTMAL